MALDALGSDGLQRVLGFLPLHDRASLLASSRSLHDSEPLVTHATSSCGRCAACLADTAHLCGLGARVRPASFWAGLLRGSRPTGLAELRLAGCASFNVADVLKSAEATAALAPLRVLALDRCPSLGTAEALAMFGSLSGGLVELQLRDMTVDSSALRDLLARHAHSLRVLDLQGCHTITGDDVRAIAASCRNLRELSLWGCHNVDNAALVELAQRMPTLRRLNLRYVHRVDDSVVAAIATHLPALKELNLRYCFKVSDAGVARLCEGLPLLEKLNLSQCTRITDAAIWAIATTLGSLRELRLWGCTKLTSAAVIAISRGLPALTLLDIRSRDSLESVIGGQLALKFLIQTYRNTLAQWEQALGEQDGVFKRLDEMLDVPA